MVTIFKCPSDATPITDASDLIPIWVHNFSDLNRVEAENIALAQGKYLALPIRNPKLWFHSKELKRIHKSMFGQVWNWAGKYRKSITSIGIKPALIPYRLEEFCAEVASWFENPVELTFLEMSARIHHQLVLIHPFENGNGRFSRLIADRFLFSCRCPYPQWPTQLGQEGKIRKQYIQSLKNADLGDYDPLVDFMRNFGGKDPDLTHLLKDNFYKVHLRGKQGASLVKALLKRNRFLEENNVVLKMAQKAKLDEIVELLLKL